jgi:Flp pilus assembly pilin Flp
VGLHASDTDLVGRRRITDWGVVRPKGVTVTRKLLGAFKSLLYDESGQTMLEYIVIVVFVVLVLFLGSRMVGPMVNRQIKRTSVSIEQ